MIQMFIGSRTVLRAVGPLGSLLPFALATFECGHEYSIRISVPPVEWHGIDMPHCVMCELIEP